MMGRTSHNGMTVSELAAVPPPPAVTRLVRNLLDGAEEAEAAFYEAFYPVVKKFVRNWHSKYFAVLGIRPGEEDDDCQNAMIRLIYGDRYSTGFKQNESPLKRWLNYNGPTRLSLYRFVQWNVNYYLRDLRRVRGAIFIEFEADLGMDLSEHPEVIASCSATLSPEELVQFRYCIRWCWKEMNPWHRNVLEQVGMMGYSQADTAVKLGVSEPTVSRWLRAATTQFRACLKANCPDKLLPFSAKK